MTIRILACLAVIAIAGCSPPSQSASQSARAPLEGAAIGGPFTLTDQDGRPITDRAFAGKYRVMYFGYTWCPDVCPLDVQNIAAALKLLDKSAPAMAARIVPVFVTLDPARDTPPVLRQFVRAFDSRLIGLTGSEAAIASVAKAYGIYHARGDAVPGGGYLVDHSRQAYLMDPQGKPLALLPNEGPPQAIADELAKWIK